MLTREEFIEKWRHEVGGMILDGATLQATGAELGLFVRNILRKVDQRLGQMHHDLTADIKPVVGRIGKGN